MAKYDHKTHDEFSCIYTTRVEDNQAACQLPLRMMLTALFLFSVQVCGVANTNNIFVKCKNMALDAFAKIDNYQTTIKLKLEGMSKVVRHHYWRGCCAEGIHRKQRRTPPKPSHHTTLKNAGPALPLGPYALVNRTSNQQGTRLAS